MAHKIIVRLNKSLSELESSIRTTRSILMKKEGIPSYVIEHVDQYSTILEKQRSLASQLEGYLADNDFEQVTRHVRLINGLSQMIKEDAQSIIEDSNKVPKQLVNDTFVC